MLFKTMSSLKEITSHHSKMIIPVKCFGCGKVIADKWLAYSEKVEKLRAKHAASNNNDTDTDTNTDTNTNTNIDPIHTKEIFESLNIERMCCKIHFLGHVDLIDKI